MSLQATAVGVTLGEQRVLVDASIEVQTGTVTLLAGRNGSGKTTLLTVLAGLRSPETGSVLLDGDDVATMPPRDRAQRITMIPQDADSPFEFTGRELVLMGRHPHIPRLRSPAATDHDAVASALARVDATDFADRPVTTLSGGERRRIGVARALATGAAWILADEPTANLDLDHGLAMMRLFREHAAAGGGVLLVSHDINAAAPFCDRAALLHEGRVRGIDTPQRALDDRAFAEVFGVRSSGPVGYFPRAFDAAD